MTWESTLKAPMKDRIWATVSGVEHEAGVAMRCGLALKVPQFQFRGHENRVSRSFYFIPAGDWYKQCVCVGA